MMESVHEDCGNCVSPDFSNKRVPTKRLQYSDGMSTSRDPMDQEEVDKLIESYTQRINLMNVEILELRMDLKHEQHAIEVIREMNEKSDHELAKLIQQERQKNESLAHDYQTLLEDYRFLLDEYEEMNKRKEVEMQSIVLTSNQLKTKLQEVEVENDKLLNELVQCKVDYANLSMSVDDLSAEKNDLQRTVDSYKALIAKGELIYKPPAAVPLPAAPDCGDVALCNPPAGCTIAHPSIFLTQIQPIISYINSNNVGSLNSNSSLSKAMLSTDSSDPMPGVQIIAHDLEIEDASCEEIVFV